MADVVGLTASIFTLTDAATKLGKLINNLRHAPAEVLSLANEVSDLRFVFSQVREVIKLRPESVSNLSSTLSRADAAIAALTGVIERYTSRSISAPDGIRWVLGRGKVKNLKEELREIRLQLTTLLVANTLYDSISFPTHYDCCD